MRSRLIALALLLVAASAAYWFLVRDRAVEAQLRLPRATATIGTGSEAIAVDPEGQILAWLPLSEDLQLPYLPLSSPPESGRLAGTALEQARVLGAAPARLRPY